MALVNEARKFAYNFEPHTASRAVSTALLALPSSRLIGKHHATQQQMRVEEPNTTYDDYRWCVTVRNPLDTLVTRWTKRDIRRYPTLLPYVEKFKHQSQSVLFGLDMWQTADTFVWFEHLYEDVERLFDLTLPERDPIHVTKLKTKQWYEYYDKETFDVVFPLFKDYCDKFGYHYAWSKDGLLYCGVYRDVRESFIKHYGVL